MALTQERKLLVVGGQVFLPEEGYRGLLTGYDAEGQLDTSVGKNGFLIPSAGRPTRIDDVISGENDTLICVGTIASAAKTAGMIFGRMENGAPDPAFNNGGITGTTIGQGSEWYSTAKEPTVGTIVATGITFEPLPIRITVGRYLRTGEADKSFGNGEGWVMLEQGWEPRLILQADGKVLICAGDFDGIRNRAFVTRLMN